VIELCLVAALAVPGDTLEYRGDEGSLLVTPPRVETPGVHVDGRLDEAAWSGAAVLTGFTQFQPVEGIPASQETEVRVIYGPQAIYFGIVAHDDDPSGIQATLTERDEGVTEDDWIRITLDTFNDRTQAYAFYVNPRGVQADGLWVEGGRGRGPGGFGPPIDFNPDFLWESDARVTETGWEAEIRVPFRSLRFREAAEQAWGVNVVREVRRTEYQSSWAPLTEDAANQLELAGLLEGLEGLEPRRLIEVNPVATGRRTGELTDDGDFVRQDFEPDFGVNARYGVTRNLVLDATFNPDFSQVEADADQVVVNERFAIFFPEKRPFFLEGTEVFNTPQQLVHTRAIVDPIGGAKLTGKVGSFNLGYLGALDESPVTFDEGDQEAAFNLFRLRGDLGGGSNVGGLYTDRTLLDGAEYNRVGSVDTRLVLGDRYTVTAQLAGAWSRVRDEETGSVDDLAGPLFAARIARSGRVFSWNAGIEDVHPDFRAQSGFIRRIGDTELSGETRYTFPGEPGALLEEVTPRLEARAFFDHEDFWSGRKFQEAELEAGIDFSLRGPNGVVLLVTNGYYAFDPADYAAYEVPAAGGAAAPFTVPAPLENMLGVRMFGRTRPLPWLSLGGRGSYGEVPIYAEASRGTELQIGPSADLRFPFGFTADLSFTFSRIWRESGELYGTAQIPRARLQYQLTRALFVRGILQYNLQRQDALRDPDGVALVIDGEGSVEREEGEVQYDLLVSYEPSPGTIVYAGWSRVREGPDTYRFGDLVPVAEGLFVKVSYLFRL
jgi:hypothetical protein